MPHVIEYRRCHSNDDDVLLHYLGVSVSKEMLGPLCCYYYVSLYGRHLIIIIVYE